jgi:hypothetical protein
MQASHCGLHVPDKAKGRLFSVLHGSGASVNFSLNEILIGNANSLDKERNGKSVLPTCKF